MKKIKQLIILSVFTLTTIYLFSLTLLIQRIYFDNKKPSEYILVLGARSYKKQGQYNPCLYGRVLHAVDLYKQGYSKKLIFTGGTDKEDGQNEAETMKKIAIELGIPENNIYLEKESASTFENIEYSKKIIGSYSTIIVTEVFHSPRAGMVAAKQNLNFTLSPAVNTSCWIPWKYLSRYFLKEPFAIIYYKLEGKI